MSYCGTKDKRGKTTQKFCIRKIIPKRIVDAAKYIKGMQVGNFEFADSALKLGQLKGNHFSIALRYVKGDRSIIENALAQVSENGFINYFGLQRFGNCFAVPTFKVGQAIIKCDYKLVSDIFK